MSTDHHYGVSIGIDTYPGIGNLGLARKDASAFADWLTTAGVTGDRLERVMLPDDAAPPAERRGAEPRADQIWEAVRDKIMKVRQAVKTDPRVWQDTRLYFFFSGHGVAPTARDASGLAADCSADDYGNSASLNAMVDYFLESADFAEVVVIADCCRLAPAQSGTLPGRPPWTPKSSSGPEDVRVAELYATRYRTPALEPGKARDLDSERGYFTRAILEGLAGATGAVQDGQVTTLGLIQYARQRVIDLTDGKQRPPAEVGADLLLVSGLGTGEARKSAGRTVRIEFPVGFQGEVQLLDGALNEVSTHLSDGAPWELVLDRGLYLVQARGVEFRDGGQLRIDDGDGEVDAQL